MSDISYPRHDRRDPVRGVVDHQVGQPHHRVDGRADDRLHLLGRQHRQRDLDRRGRHRSSHRARHCGHCHLPHPQLAHRQLRGPSTTLVPGQTATFTGTYTVTAADLAHGSIVDTAMAAGTSSSGGSTSRPSNPVTIEETHVSVVKSASPSGGVVAGSSNPIVYLVKVANIGTAATIEPVVVTDAPRWVPHSYRDRRRAPAARRCALWCSRAPRSPGRFRRGWPPRPRTLSPSRGRRTCRTRVGRSPTRPHGAVRAAVPRWLRPARRTPPAPRCRPRRAPRR